MEEIVNIQFTKNDTTVSLLSIALNSAGKEGLSLDDIRARSRVADVIEGVKAKGKIKLEHADYLTAQRVVKDVRWGAFARHLLKFAEQFGL